MSEPVDPTPYLPLVRIIAGRLWRSVRPRPRLLEFDDLVGAGMVGLMQSAHSYRPGRSAFATYASSRIRGEMLNSLHGWDDMVVSGYARRRICHGDIAEPVVSSLDAVADDDGVSLTPSALTVEPDIADEVDLALRTAMERLPRALSAIIERHVIDGVPLGRLAQAGMGRSWQELRERRKAALRELECILRQVAAETGDEPWTA